jgi:predicted membrane-bound spermidine synthase
MRRYLYFTVFISGLCSLSLEMTGSRLLESTFGSSNLVWAAVIGLILIYLAVGYFLGGKWADRSASHALFYRILIAAALSIAVIPLVAKPILNLASRAFDQLQFGVLGGAFAVVIVLMAVPVILLGTASPFAIRLAVRDSRTIGSVSGRIYAISTLGSFVGTFLPPLILIPLAGTSLTFLIISATLLLTAIVGLMLTNFSVRSLPILLTPVFLLAAGFWLYNLPSRTTDGMIFETESAYNYIQVLEFNGYHLLRLNEGQGIHSIHHPTILRYTGPWDQVLAAPFFNPAPVDPAGIQSMAIIGLAAGTTARQASFAYPGIQIDGFEIDPKIVQVGNQYFDMDEIPGLTVFVQDGRWGLEHSPNRYQVISIDAYRPPYIPWHMTTVEFFQSVHDHLTPDGVMVINVGRAPQDRRLINTLSSTILQVFPSVHVMDLPNSFNSLVYATVQPTATQNLTDNLHFLLPRSDIHPLLAETAQFTLINLMPAPPLDLIFTDDRAPIEWITNNLVLHFILSGQTEELQ